MPFGEFAISFVLSGAVPLSHRGNTLGQWDSKRRFLVRSLCKTNCNNCNNCNKPLSYRYRKLSHTVPKCPTVPGVGHVGQWDSWTTGQ